MWVDVFWAIMFAMFLQSVIVFASIWFGYHLMRRAYTYNFPSLGNPETMTGTHEETGVSTYSPDLYEAAYDALGKEPEEVRFDSVSNTIRNFKDTNYGVHPNDTFGEELAPFMREDDEVPHEDIIDHQKAEDANGGR